MRPEEGLMNWDNSGLSRDKQGRGNNETEKQISLEVRRGEASDDRSLWSERIAASIQVMLYVEKEQKETSKLMLGSEDVGWSWP